MLTKMTGGAAEVMSEDWLQGRFVYTHVFSQSEHLHMHVFPRLAALDDPCCFAVGGAPALVGLYAGAALTRKAFDCGAVQPRDGGCDGAPLH